LANRVVFINGPAGSGKDTVARFLIEQFSARHYKLSWPLKKALGAFFDLSHEDYNRVFETAEKDQPQPLLYGEVPRQTLISLSEEWAKRRFDDTVLGRLAIRFIKHPSQSPFVAISDSGFRSECAPIVKWLGPKNCLVIQLYREGHTYEGDSRGYLDLSDIGVTTVELRNRFDLDMFKMQCTVIIDKWLAELDE
jgi:hypothetical protein